MHTTKSLALLTVTAALLSACSSPPLNPQASASMPAAPSAPDPIAPTSAAAQQRSAPVSTVASVVIPAHLDAESAIWRERSVYFDYDEFAIKPEYTVVIERHGKYLASAPSLAIKIEGHADERGGSEYNLALGQKRAEAVMRALRLYGVKPSQMEATSWGEERPKATGRDEAAWAQNRRDDLQYPKQ